MMQLISLRDLDIAGKRIFIRCDFNVPLDEFKNITDDRRIKSRVNSPVPLGTGQGKRGPYICIIIYI